MNAFIALSAVVAPFVIQPNSNRPHKAPQGVSSPAIYVKQESRSVNKNDDEYDLPLLHEVIGRLLSIIQSQCAVHRKACSRKI
jgi:hypothetical protein